MDLIEDIKKINYRRAVTATEHNQMDSRSLNTFIQVAETNSFTRAGEILGYSQPTISFQIKQLENELGVQLFDRIGHTVSLTEGGREVLTYAQRICHMMQEMTQGASKKFEPNGNVHIGLPDSLCGPLIVSEFKTFRQKYPHVSIKLTPAGTADLFRMLDHNEVDMICTIDEPVYDTSYLIAHEEKISVHFICSTQNPLALQQEVFIDQLMGQPFIVTEKGMSYRRLLDENLAKRSLEIQLILETSNADLICRLVEENAGISFLPDYVTEGAVKRGTVKRLQVKDFNVSIHKQLLYHRNKWVSLPMKAMIEYLTQLPLAGEAQIDA